MPIRAYEKYVKIFDKIFLKIISIIVIYYHAITSSISFIIYWLSVIAQTSGWLVWFKPDHWLIKKMPILSTTPKDNIENIGAGMVILGDIITAAITYKDSKSNTKLLRKETLNLITGGDSYSFFKPTFYYNSKKIILLQEFMGQYPLQDVNINYTFKCIQGYNEDKSSILEDISLSELGINEELKDGYIKILAPNSEMKKIEFILPDNIEIIISIHFQTLYKNFTQTLYFSSKDNKYRNWFMITSSSKADDYFVLSNVPLPSSRVKENKFILNANCDNTWDNEELILHSLSKFDIEMIKINNSELETWTFPKKLRNKLYKIYK